MIAGFKKRLANYSTSIWAAIRTALFPLVLFEILYRLVTTLILKPLLSEIMQLMLNATGIQLAFNDSIVEFFLTVPGFVAGIIFVVVSALFVYYEFAVVITIVYTAIRGKQVTLRGAMEQGWRSMRMLKNSGIIGFCFYSLLLLPVANLGYASSLMPSLAIPNFITGELYKMNGGGFLVFLMYAVIFLLFFCTIFTVPAMVLKELPFGKAWGENFILLRRYGPKILLLFAAFLATWGILYRLPKALLSMIFFMPDVSFTKIIDTFGFSWETLLLGALLVALFIVQMFLMPILMVLLLSGYHRLCGTEEITLDPDDDRLYKGEKNPISFASIERVWMKWVAFTKRKWFKRLRIPLIIVVGVIVTTVVFDLFDFGYGLHPPIVVGHRGSAYGVENTTEAIDAAIEAEADYAEVDILLSKDGVPMVIHDTNLGRLAGENVNVYELTAKDLGKIELYQNGYEGKISTLEEVIDHCRGKIKLAIELKTHGYEERNLVDAIFEVLEAEDFVEECMLLAMEYNFVEEINTKHPDSFAGYCVFGNVGNFDPSTIYSMKIDFVVVEEAMVTKQLLKRFREGWTPVYVWTVNDPRNMKQYLEMGVLGLVTDQPYDANYVRALYYEEENPKYYDANGYEVPYERIPLDDFTTEIVTE